MLGTLINAGLVSDGSKVFANFEGGLREATLDDQGRLHLDDGTVHRTPSGAARRVTGHETNGWNFWRLEVDGNAVSLKELRDQHGS